MENLLTIGERIRVKRKEHSLTQGKLAELIGVQRQKVTQIESNYIKPDFDFLSKFIRICNTSYLYVIEGTEEVEKPGKPSQTKTLPGYRELIELIDEVRKTSDPELWLKLKTSMINILERNQELNDMIVRLYENRDKMLNMLKRN